MLAGEVALVTAAWRYAYEGRRDAPAGLQAPAAQDGGGGGGGGSVEFEVELLDFAREATQHELLPGAEKLAVGERLKQQGNQLFKQARCLCL